MSDTINFQPGSTVGEIVIVDGKSWTWDGKKWVLSDSFTNVSTEFVKKEGDTMSGDLLLQDGSGDPAEYIDATDPSTAVNKKYVDESFLTDTTRNVFFNNPDVDEYKMTYIHNGLNEQDFDTTINLNVFENPNLNGGHAITQCHNSTGLGYHCIHEEYLEKVLTYQVYQLIAKQGTFKLDFNGKQPGRPQHDQQPPSGAVWHYSGVAVVPGEANRLLINNVDELDGYCVSSNGTVNVSYVDAAKCGLSGQLKHTDHEFTDVKGGTYIRGTLKKIKNPNVNGGFHHALIEDRTSPVFFSPVQASTNGGVYPKIYSVAMRGSGPYEITYRTEKYSTKSEVVELEEEIEALAPTTERGVWEESPIDTLSNGRFYMKSGGNITTNYEDELIDFIAISRIDKTSVSHGFTRDEVGDLIQILDQNDDNYGLFEIVDKDDADPDFVTFDVKWVQGVGFTTAYQEVRIKIFSPPSADVDAYVVKAGDKMSGRLRLQKPDGSPDSVTFEDDNLDFAVNMKSMKAFVRGKGLSTPKAIYGIWDGNGDWPGGSSSGVYVDNSRLKYTRHVYFHPDSTIAEYCRDSQFTYCGVTVLSWAKDPYTTMGHIHMSSPTILDDGTASCYMSILPAPDYNNHTWETVTPNNMSNADKKYRFNTGQFH